MLNRSPSSVGVFGVPIDETHALRPCNVYGESKLMTERMLEWFHIAHGLRLTQRQTRGPPGEEAQRRRRRSIGHATQDRFIDRHVRRAVVLAGVEESPGGEGIHEMGDWPVGELVGCGEIIARCKRQEV